jgi:ribosome-associated protein
MHDRQDISASPGTPHLPPDIELIVEAMRERNARELVLLDLRGISDATDWFLIASGDSDTHARAIADNVVARGREAGLRPAGVEGERAASWILIDYLSAVVHVFLPRVREFYRLEELWGDAPLTQLEEG